MNDTVPIQSQPTFETQIVELCHVLEQWRAERKEALATDSNDFPRFEWKAGWQSLVFYVVYGLSSFLLVKYKNSHDSLSAISAIALALTVIISGVAGSLLLLFQAIGLGKAQFWRTLKRQITTKDTYPFSTLHYSIRIDLEASPRLRSYATNLLVVVHERLGLEEADLRERLITMAGNPTALAVLGLAAGVWTSWQNFYGHDGWASKALFGVSVMAFLLVLKAARWRVSLFELTHCRLLLSLEIARRKAQQ
jgi:hypothetical protein